MSNSPQEQKKIKGLVGKIKGNPPKTMGDVFNMPFSDLTVPPEHRWNGTKLSFEDSNHEWGEETDLKGEKGDSIKGDKGEDGFTPIKGQDYLTDEELQGIKNEITPIKGQDYFTADEINNIKKEVTPIKGIHYFDGRPGQDGKSIKGKDGETLKIEDIIKAVTKHLHGLKGADRLPLSALKENELLMKLGSTVGKKINTADERWHGGGLSKVTIGSGLSGSGTPTDPLINTSSGGTVTSVSSANADIGVATGTTTPVLTLNKGTSAGQIIALDGTGKLPAVDGSQLTNLPIGSGNVVGPASATNNDFVQFDNTTGKLIKDGGISLSTTVANPGSDSVIPTEKAIRTAIAGAGGGTVTTVSVVTANGVSGSVANATTTPAITLALGAITPSSVNSVVVSGSATPTLAVTGTSSISGANTGDQTLPVGGTPALTLGTANAAGSAATFVKTDATLLAFDATAPSTQAFGDSAVVGSATVAARRDHKHAMMAAPTSVSGNAGTVTGATFTKNLTVDTGNVQLSGDAGNTSHLSIGSGAVSVSGLNTGDNTVATALTGTPSITVNTVTTTGNIELGNASDTTIARVSAGVVSIEGVTVDTISATNTLTNKRITPRILSATSYTTDTGTSLNCDNLDQFIVTAQAGNLKLNNPTGTPTDGQKLLVAITGTAARALTYDTQFEASTVALPTTTVTTARLNIGFIWRADTSKWVCIAVS